MHPSQVLFKSQMLPVNLPVCDHYAGNRRFAEKALALQAKLGPVFDITLDLEDGAAIGSEAELAEQFSALIASELNRYSRVGLRVHEPHHPHFIEDLHIALSLAGPRLAYLMVPKVNSANDVANAVEAVDREAAALGLNKLIPIHILIETLGALREVFRIAAHPRVESLSFGLMDFVSAHNGAIGLEAMRSPGQFQHPLIVRAKTEIASACHSYGKIPSHNVSTALQDPAQLAQDARQAREAFGYTRMWSIHPEQITPIVQAFTPLASEVDQACEILIAAQAAQWGPIQYHNSLHDRASYRYFWSILQRAQQTGTDLPEAARVLLNFVEK